MRNDVRTLKKRCNIWDVIKTGQWSWSRPVRLTSKSKTRESRSCRESWKRAGGEICAYRKI